MAHLSQHGFDFGALQHNSPINLPSSIHTIHKRFNELSLSLASPSPDYIHSAQPSWISPPPGWLKINVDVALSTASLVAIARDHLGVPIKIWARIMKVNSPLLAESEVLL